MKQPLARSAGIHGCDFSKLPRPPLGARRTVLPGPPFLCPSVWRNQNDGSVAVRMTPGHWEPHPIPKLDISLGAAGCSDVHRGAEWSPEVAAQAEAQGLPDCSAFWEVLGAGEPCHSKSAVPDGPQPSGTEYWPRLSTLTDPRT